jgi:hypothetical protein
MSTCQLCGTASQMQRRPTSNLKLERDHVSAVCHPPTPHSLKCRASNSVLMQTATAMCCCDTPAAWQKAQLQQLPSAAEARLLQAGGLRHRRRRLAAAQLTGSTYTRFFHPLLAARPYLHRCAANSLTSSFTFQMAAKLECS